MRNVWTRRLLAVLLGALLCGALIRLWMSVDAGFVASFAFFAILILVVAPLAKRLAHALA